MSSRFRNRAYFQDITILLPASWTDNPAYSAPSGNETYSSSSVVISNPLTSSNVTRVVRPSQDCGTVDIRAKIVTSSATLMEGELQYWAQVCMYKKYIAIQLVKRHQYM